MSWTSLKNGIATVIKTNGNQEITGNALQGVLNSMVNALGAHATFAGMAIPSTSPGTPDGPVFYFAFQEGSYPNFGTTPLIISEDEFGIFIWDGVVWYTIKYTLSTSLSEIVSELTQLGSKIDETRRLIFTETTDIATSQQPYTTPNGQPQAAGYVVTDTTVKCKRFDVGGLTHIWLTAAAHGGGNWSRYAKYIFFAEDADITTEGNDLGHLAYHTGDEAFEGIVEVPAGAKWCYTIGSSSFTVKAVTITQTNRFDTLESQIEGIEEQVEALPELTQKVNSIYDDPENVMPTDSRLDANTDIKSSDDNGWALAQNAVSATVVGDHVAVVTSATVWSGIRSYAIPDLSLFSNVEISFEIKVDDELTNNMRFYWASGDAYTIFNPTDSWTKQTFVVPASDIARFQIAIGQSSPARSFSVRNFCVKSTQLSINTRIANIENGCLFGKKVAVIGDSISTIYGNNTPYWTVQDGDVGETISAYVTWWDVWTNDDGTVATGKTIGGVTLTASMIGTLQTFQPVAEDVGKKIGVALNYNAEGRKVWSQALCEATGATLVANASWSGAQMVCGQGEDSSDVSLNNKTHSLSYAWSDYTIGRIANVRDDNGNQIIPDVIFVYRGTNDMTHVPVARITDVDLTSGVPSTDLVDGNRNYVVAYVKTIQKLRTAFPKAIIYCCTLNYFRRSTDIGWTRKNSYYTLADINNKIRDIANMMGCGVVEFDKDGITALSNPVEYYADGSGSTPTHPNAAGHAVMARRALSDVRFV